MSQRFVALSALIAAATLALLPAAASATYPGQNGAIAYAQAKYDKRAKDAGYFGLGALRTVLPDGSGATALPDDPGYDDFEPAWSNDGSALAYASVGSGKYNGIYTLEAGATDFRLLASAKYPDGPTWAPNGTSVAYVDYAKGIYVVDTVTGAPPQLILRKNKRFDLGAPAYSADGQALFFSRANLSTAGKFVNGEIWASGRAGENPRKVLGGAGDLRSIGEPDVSPDSKQLVFAAYLDSGKPGVWVANVDGSGARRLIASTKQGFFTGPCWSPDGKKILASLMYGSIKNGSALVMIDPVTGTTETVRKLRKGYVGTVSWQPLPVATPAG